MPFSPAPTGYREHCKGSTEITTIALIYLKGPQLPRVLDVLGWYVLEPDELALALSRGSRTA